MVGIITEIYYLTSDKITANLITISILLGCAILKFFFNEVKSKIEKNNYLRSITVTIDNMSKTLNAYIDTGNELSDPMTGKPVIVVNIESISELIGEDIVKEILEFYDNIEDNYINLFLEKRRRIKLRVVKYNTISDKGKLMVCVVPDEITISCSNKSTIRANAVIGIYPQKISGREEYDALLFKKLLDWESDANNEINGLFSKIFSENT
jgi:stage II sporulation protein GA (sporulation sigma-E factor processing peptidase)